jgi:hypothetical protein
MPFPRLAGRGTPLPAMLGKRVLNPFAKATYFWPNLPQCGTMRQPPLDIVLDFDA